MTSNYYLQKEIDLDQFVEVLHDSKFLYESANSKRVFAIELAIERDIPLTLKYQNIIISDNELTGLPRKFKCNDEVAKSEDSLKNFLGDKLDTEILYHKKMDFNFKNLLVDCELEDLISGVDETELFPGDADYKDLTVVSYKGKYCYMVGDNKVDGSYEVGVHKCFVPLFFRQIFLNTSDLKCLFDKLTQERDYHDGISLQSSYEWSPELKEYNDIIYEFASSLDYKKHGEKIQQELIQSWVDENYPSLPSKDSAKRVLAKLISKHYKINTGRSANK